jgi:TetR/AcrR family transcriptional repressor of nem operon
VVGCPFFTSGAQSGTEEQLIRRAAIEMAEKSIVYSIALVRNLTSEGYLDDPIDAKVLGRMFSHYIQGVLLYGRVMMDLPMVADDLREGLYRVLSLKHQYRSKPTS